jgi:hypothetical protein
MPDKIAIDGLRELQTQLRRADANLPKQLRLALNAAADEVIDYAQARFPRKSGQAAASLKSRSSQREARVGLGGRRAPYAPWLDFGGQGRHKGRPPKREFIKDGRYVYAGLRERRPQIEQILERALGDVARDAGFTVES